MSLFCLFKDTKGASFFGFLINQIVKRKSFYTQVTKKDKKEWRKCWKNVKEGEILNLYSWKYEGNIKEGKLLLSPEWCFAIFAKEDQKIGLIYCEIEVIFYKNWPKL